MILMSAKSRRMFKIELGAHQWALSVECLPDDTQGKREDVSEYTTD